MRTFRLFQAFKSLIILIRSYNFFTEMLLLKTEPCSYQGSLTAQFRFIALVGLFTLHFICGLYDKSSQSHMNYKTTVQPEVALREIPLVSDLGPHMKVAQTRSDH